MKFFPAVIRNIKDICSEREIQTQNNFGQERSSAIQEN